MSYMKMPDELKLAIWREVLPEIPTMYHLKIAMPNRSGQVMEVSPVPGALYVSPTSTEYWNASAIDIVAREVAALDQRVIIWQADKAKIARLKARAKSKNGGEEPLRYGDKLTINANIDVVHCKFAGDIFDPTLPHILNQPLFAGIKRVAVDWKALLRGNQDSQPFQCLCNHATHFACPESIAGWLSHFKDIEVFYIVVKLYRKGINWKALIEEFNRCQSVKYQRRQEDPVLKDTLVEFTLAWQQATDRLMLFMAQPATSVIGDCMYYFKDRAETDGLDVFQDNGKKYYEVTESNYTRILTEQAMIYGLLMGLQNRWRSPGYLAHTPSMQAKAQETKFKVLVYV